MDNKYNVDDILNEIKRKKSERLAGIEEEAPVYHPAKHTEDGEYVPKHGIDTAELQKIKRREAEKEPAPEEKPVKAENGHSEYDRFLREYAGREKKAESARFVVREPNAEKAPAAEKKAKYSAKEPDAARESEQNIPDPYIPRTARITQREPAPMPTYTDDYRDEPMANRRIQIDDTLQDFFRPKEEEPQKPRRAKRAQKNDAFTVVSGDDGDDYEPLHSAPKETPTEREPEEKIYRGKAEPEVQQREIATNYEELKRQRSYKVNSFSLDSSKEEEPEVIVRETPSTVRAREEFESRGKTDAAEKKTDDEDIEEYTSPDQKESVERDFLKQKNTLTVRLIATCAICLALVIMALNAAGVIGLPASVDFGGGENSLFYIVNILLLCAAVLVCHIPVGGGLLALFRMRANSDTLVSVSVIASVMHAVSMVVLSDRITVLPANIYFWVPVLALVFNTIGKLGMLERISGNFGIVSAEGEKSALSLDEDPDIRKRLTGVRRDTRGKVAGVSRVKLLSGFLGISYDDDFADNLYRTAAPITIGVSLLAAVVLYFVRRDIFLSFTAFAALTAIGAPFTSTLAAALPLGSACSSLRQENAMLANYSAAEELSDVNVVLLDATDLFRPGDIELHAIKTFSRGRVDEALLDTASVISQVKNTLSFIFEKVISGNTAMLKSYDNLVYEDGMGLSAWVNSKRVLIGNRMLMEHHSVETPDIEYERRYTSAGQNVIYLSNSGELTAMFVLSYKASEETQEALDIFKRRGITLSVSSTDPNVTAELLSRLFDFPEERINIISSRYQGEFDAVCAPRESMPASACAGDTLHSFAHLIDSAYGVRNRVSLAVMLQLIGMVIGCVLVAFFAFIGGISSMSALFVMVYQLCWLVIVMAAGALRLK